MQSVAGDARSKELIGQVSGIANALMAEVSKVIIGKQENLMRTTVAILSNGNMLLEDFPGLGKTMLANTFAQALGCKFKRVQFTPDLLPSDIMGTYMYDQKSGNSSSEPGRCSPTSCSQMRSIVHHRRHRRRSSKRWRRNRSRSRASRTDSLPPSLSSPHRIPSNRRGPIRFPRPKWIDSS